MNNSIIKYHPNSLMRTFNPLIKFSFNILAIITAFLPVGLTGYTFVTMFAITAFIVAQGTWSAFRKVLYPTILMYIVLMFINWFIVVPPAGENWVILFNLDNTPVYVKSMHNTTTIVLRVFNILLLGSIFSATTENREIARVFEILLSPLLIVKVPVHKVAMIIALALKFIPELLFNFRSILNAQASRGVDYSSRNPREKVTAFKNALIPMFVIMFKKSESVSFSMEIRGIENKGRTNFKKLPFTWNDIALLLVLCGLITLIVLLSLDKGGEWIPRFADANWWKPNMW